MSAVLALWQKDGRAVDHCIVEEMVEACPQRTVDGYDIRLRGSNAFAHQHFWVTPEEVGERQPLQSEQPPLLVTADIRLDNRSELVSLLRLDQTEARFISDTSLLIHAYRRWGKECCRYLLGDFAFIIWDASANCLFAARDALGGRGLCYYTDSKISIVASEIQTILAHPDVPQRLNEAKLATILGEVWYEGEATLFEGIQFCEPGCCLLIHESGIRKWRYWDPSPSNTIRYRRDEEYAEHFRSLLNEAVDCRLRTWGKVGLSLSGGIDSTSVAAIAAPLLRDRSHGPLLSFSYVFDQLTDCDERNYIEEVATYHGIRAHYVPADDLWTLKDPAEWPVLCDAIMVNAYYWPQRAVALAAQEQGCRVFLTGQYGDSLFTGGVYALADMVREARFKDVVQFFGAKQYTSHARRTMLGAGLRDLAPAALRRAYRALRRRRKSRAYFGLSDDFVDRHELESKRELSRVQRAGFPRSWQHRYDALLSPVWPQDFHGGRKLYTAHRLEPAQPFYDRRLVEFMLAVPADQLTRPQQTRWVLRMAMRRDLPTFVLNRSEKTSFVPLFERGILDRERITFCNLANYTRVIESGFFRPEWIQRTIADAEKLDDDVFFLWLCFCVDLWLRRCWSP